MTNCIAKVKHISDIRSRNQTTKKSILAKMGEQKYFLENQEIKQSSETPL